MGKDGKPLLFLGITAVYVGGTGFAWFRGLDSGTPDLVSLLLGYAVLVGAVAAAVSLWKRSSWAMNAYIIWAILVLANNAWFDYTVETVWWMLALWQAVVAVILFVVGAAAKGLFGRQP